LRVVHSVKIHKKEFTSGTAASGDKWSIFVGSADGILSSRKCRDVVHQTGWQTTTCKAPLAGRFVVVRSSATMTLCEVEIHGTVGPAPPKSFTITGCAAAGVADATYALSGVV